MPVNEYIIVYLYSVPITSTTNKGFPCMQQIHFINGSVPKLGSPWKQGKSTYPLGDWWLWLTLAPHHWSSRLKPKMAIRKRGIKTRNMCHSSLEPLNPNLYVKSWNTSTLLKPQVPPESYFVLFLFKRQSGLYTIPFPPALVECAKVDKHNFNRATHPACCTWKFQW